MTPTRTTARLLPVTDPEVEPTQEHARPPLHAAPHRDSPLHRALARNLAAVRARVDTATRAAGRADAPRLVAVTKSVPAPVARALAEIGQVELGENRLQVLEPKLAAFADEPPRLAADAPPVRWHFVGHLQRNKAARVLRQVDALHAADSPRLVEALARAAADLERTVEVFVQVKLWPEENKGGLAPDEVADAVARLAAAPNLSPVGLMTMAPLLDDPAAREDAAATVFEGARDLADRLVDAGAPFAGRPLLSMGMSDDLEAAVRAGSDWLRIGRALFVDLPADSSGS